MRPMNIAPLKYSLLKPAGSDKFTEDLQIILGNHYKVLTKFRAKCEPLQFDATGEVDHLCSAYIDSDNCCI